jgi:multimeric flavodoxin WrbA
LENQDRRKIMAELKRVVAICGSSRAGVPEEKSLTERMLENFLAGMNPEHCRIFYPHLMNISYCRGCYTCWFKTPGICAIEDDMTEIRAEIDKADLIILASPVYVDGFSAQTKVVLDRIIPMFDPLISVDDRGTAATACSIPAIRKQCLSPAAVSPKWTTLKRYAVILKLSAATFTGRMRGK